MFVSGQEPGQLRQRIRDPAEADPVLGVRIQRLQEEVTVLEDTYVECELLRYTYIIYCVIWIKQQGINRERKDHFLKMTEKFTSKQFKFIAISVILYLCALAGKRLGMS